MRKGIGKLKKVVTERYPISIKRGGGIIKIEAWEDAKGNIVKYSMAYINPLIFSGDHGRVIDMTTPTISIISIIWVKYQK